MSASKIKEFRFSSWNDFKAGFFLNLPKYDELSPDKIVYRGQRCSSWELTPSFDRLYKSQNLKGREDVFKIYLNSFKEECLKTGYACQTDSDESIAGKAQHFGMPTRLLDWTYSPYIAAFFAFSDLSLLTDSAADDDVAIWAIDKNLTQENVHSNSLDFIELYESGNERLIAQSGIFTRLYSNHDSVNKFFTDEFKIKTAPLVKFILPCTEVENALFDLSLMGITSKALFPGLEGVARYSTFKSALIYANKRR